MFVVVTVCNWFLPLFYAGLFYLDEANILKSRSPFKLNENSLVNSAVKKQLYLLRISVEDSGKPFPLSGQPNLTLRIIVLKENLYPPEIIPHRVKITTADGKFLLKNKESSSFYDFFNRSIFGWPDSPEIIRYRPGCIRSKQDSLCSRQFGGL